MHTVGSPVGFRGILCGLVKNLLEWDPDSLELVIHAVTFGTSRTSCMHPATITHEHMTSDERAAAGIDDGLIRLSVGLENVEDIITDLDQALGKL